MVITDKRIRELSIDSSLIAPFNENNLQSESYDITIGNKITLFKKEIFCLDISDQAEINKIYNEMDFPSDGYVLSPKEYILVALNETVSLPDNITAHIRPKTSYTRLGVMISAQHCNSSYSGQLRLGVFNATEYPIRIRKGYPIAQIVFEELDQIPSENKLYRNKPNAHYQNEDGEFRGAKFDDEFLNKCVDEMLK